MSTERIPCVIYQNGVAQCVTWIKAYWNNSVYMADGRVFSRSTNKQMPYAMHNGVSFRKVSK